MSEFSENIVLFVAFVALAASLATGIIWWRSHVGLVRATRAAKEREHLKHEVVLTVATMLMGIHDNELLKEFLDSSKVQTLRDYLSANKTDRMAAIMLSRVYQKAGYTREAIQILDEFVREKTAAGQRDKDYADILYNRACYNTLLWKTTNDENAKEKAFGDLAESVSISPENALNAVQDIDFAAIAHEERFQALIRSEMSGESILRTG